MRECQQCAQPLPESTEEFCPYCGAPVHVRRATAGPLVALAVLAVVVVAGAIVIFVVRPTRAVTTASAVPAESVTVPRSRPAPLPTRIPSSARPAPSTKVTPKDAAATVQAFYDAINAKDYVAAWGLGGRNLGHSYPEFVSGYSHTVHDEVTVTATGTETVSVDLVATESDGKQHHYTGSYTVRDGTITQGTMRPVGGG